MNGGEDTLMLLLEALEVAFGHDRASAEIDRLRSRGAWTSTGAAGLAVVCGRD